MTQAPTIWKRRPGARREHLHFRPARHAVDTFVDAIKNLKR
jgi:hypothetical protein